MAATSKAVAPSRALSKASNFAARSLGLASCRSERVTIADLQHSVQVLVRGFGLASCGRSVRFALASALGLRQHSPTIVVPSRSGSFDELHR
jgi:hypothetical protein